jgi:Chaperone of endosialidase
MSEIHIFRREAMRRLANDFAVAVAVLGCTIGVAFADEPIPNWSAPLVWSAPAKPAKEAAEGGLETFQSTPTPPLHFVGLNPCRLIDTRGNGFTGAYGPPALTQGVPRTFVLIGHCGISPTAEAVSLNVTVTNTQGPGFITIYPAGAAQPTVSTLNYVAGQTIANAAIVPLGDGGAITVIAGVSGTDLVIDTNGEYHPGVVTGLNGLTGDVTLAAGSNTTITPAGQTLTIASTGGLPAGTANQTLRHNGSAWIANSNLSNDGTNVEIQGILKLPDPQTRVNAGSSRFIYSDTGNLFFGSSAGGSTSGSNNTGLGNLSLLFNTSGSANTAVGYRAMNENQGGSSNTAVGFDALDENTSGSSNVAIGTNALTHVTGGNGNIGIGVNSGTNVSTGSNNIYIGNAGFNNESGQIRIGELANITSGTVIVGISGFSAIGGAPVYVNGGGRLGTSNASSLRYKDDVRAIGADSDRLMDLRPVAFKYKPEYDPKALPQYGLIAEEVANVYPELVTRDSEGRPDGVRYHLLDPLLLNEIQKQRCEIEELKARLEKLEGKSAP